MRSLKQAILEQESVFRNQVRELHRLYWTQKNLMNELRQKGKYPLSEIGNGQRNFNLQYPAENFIKLHSDTDFSKIDEKVKVVDKGLLSSAASGCNEIIDQQESIGFESTEITKKLYSNCLEAPIQKCSESFRRRLEEQNAHISSADDSNLNSLNIHSRKMMIDLNLPYQDPLQIDINIKNFKDFHNKLDTSPLPFSSQEIHVNEGSTGSSNQSISIIETTNSFVDPSKSRFNKLNDNPPQSLSRDSTNSNGSSECSAFDRTTTTTLSITGDSAITQLHSEEEDMATEAAAKALMTISFGRSEFIAKKFDVIESKAALLSEIHGDLCSLNNGEAGVVLPCLLL